jgi:hypothetical protein
MILPEFPLGPERRIPDSVPYEPVTFESGVTPTELRQGEPGYGVPVYRSYFMADGSYSSVMDDRNPPEGAVYESTSAGEAHRSEPGYHRYETDVRRAEAMARRLHPYLDTYLGARVLAATFKEKAQPSSLLKRVGRSMANSYSDVIHDVPLGTRDNDLWLDYTDQLEIADKTLELMDGSAQRGALEYDNSKFPDGGNRPDIL